MRFSRARLSSARWAPFSALMLVAGLGFGASPASAGSLTVPGFNFPGIATTDDGPADVRAGDFNRDRRVDIVTVGPNSGNVGLWLGDGHGGLLRRVGPVVGGSPTEALTTDINRDGKQDVAVLDGSRTRVSVLLGLGVVNHVVAFKPVPIAATVPADARTLTLIDLSGDGYKDLVLSSPSTQSVLIFKSNGRGAFGAPTTVSLGYDITDLQIRDVTGDRRNDLVTTVASSHVLRVIPGAGGFTFGRAISYRVCENPIDMAVADFTSDLRLDVVVTCADSTETTLLASQPNGSLVLAPNHVDTGSGIRSPQVIDVNGDGKADIVAVEPDADAVVTLIGDGAGRFRMALAPSPRPGPTSFALGDFNNDKLYDVAVLSTADDSAAVSLNDGAGVMRPAYGAVTVAPGATAFTVADVDSDRISDYIVASYEDNSVSLVSGAGIGTFAPIGTKIAIPKSGPTDVAFVDLTNDRIGDLAVVGGKSNRLYTFKGNGRGSFVPLGPPVALNGAPESIAVASLNADTRPDLVVTNSGGDCVTILLTRDSKGHFATSTVPTGAVPVPIETADLNSDRKADIVVGNSDDDTLTVLTGDGRGHLRATATLATGSDPAALAVADVNGDGKRDILAANRISGTLSVFAGQGSGTFAAPVESDIGTKGAWGMTLGDVNGDGTTDVVIASDSTGRLSVLLGDGSSTSFTKVDGIPVPGGAPQAVAIRDLNNNGKPELVWIDHAAGTIRFLLNG